MIMLSHVQELTFVKISWNYEPCTYINVIVAISIYIIRDTSLKLLHMFGIFMNICTELLRSAVAQCEVLDSRLRDCKFQPHGCHCVVSLSKTH